MSTWRVAGRVAAMAAAQSLRVAAAGASAAAAGASTAVRVAQDAADLAGQVPGAVPAGAAVVWLARATPLDGLLPRTARRARQVVLTATAELADTGPERSRRRVWHRGGHAHVEVRGLARRSSGQLAREVTARLRRVRGVRWAEVNAVSQQVLIAFDEHRVGLEAILDVVVAAEEAHGAGSDSFSRAKPEIPGDRSAEYSAAALLAVDLAALGLAGAGRLARLPGLPRAARLPVALAEAQPRVRALAEAKLGKLPAELLFGLASSGSYAATGEPLPAAVNAVQRALGVLEARGRRLAWERWCRELSAPPPPAQAPPPAPRPAPLPAGPIERTAERSSMAALAAAGGVLGWTRDPGRAAAVLLATAPKAARLGREAFAAVLGHELARSGTVTMDAAALRRLDRVSAVVIDSAVLGRDGEPDPRADALIGAARSCGDRLLLTADPVAADLLSWAHDVVPPGADLAGEVRALQAEGHGVLVISAADEAALAAADVGVALRRGAGAGWSADLLCGAQLADAWRILQAAGAARRASERSARLAAGGAALGALLVSTGGRRSRSGLSPGNAGAAAAVLGGALSARKVARQPLPPAAPRGRWHEMTVAEVCRRLGTVVPEAPGAARPAPAGPPAHGSPPGTHHEPPASPGSAPRRPAALGRLARAVTAELRDPLTPVLALGAAASAVVGSGVDAVLVGGVMAGNAVIGGVQQVRAEHALESLLLRERLPARRLAADGTVQSVDAAALAVGDLVTLRPSDVVPADLRLVDSQELEVDEATLTGESVPVAKSPEPVPGADLPDRSCLLYEGTTVVSGTGRGVVVAVGAATEAGRATAAAGRAEPSVGVQARLAELTRITIPATGAAGAAVTGLSLLHGLPFRRAVTSGIALAVAAVPEGLPLVATVSQLAAARRLSRRGILVRSARTLEALGRVDTFCFDKTGTLTEGKLRLARLAGPDSELSPADPRGRELLRAALRASPPGDGGLTHATDRAVVAAAREHLAPDEHWELLREVPFETNRGFAASLGRNSGTPRLVMKGAPEVVLRRCTRAAPGQPLTPARRHRAGEVIRALAGDGLRVIAVAESRPPAGPVPGDLDALAREMTLLGFLAIADVPRPAAARTAGRLADAGIRVAMITGDHPVTAVAVARQLGLPDPEAVLTGAELDRLPERERLRRVPRTTVFARVSPEQKVRVVQALQASGHVVAMTGDGANDAAAIRLADVGIGVAGRGSTAARTAADLVLTDPDPARLVDALAEGRSLWGRVRDAVSILVGGNAGEVAFTVLGTALGGDAPLNTRQLLLVNMLTDMLPALAVALGPAGQRRPGHDGGLPAGDELSGGPVALSTAGLARTLAVRGGATAIGASGAWYLGRVTGRRRRAATMGLGALVLTQLGQTALMGRRSPLVLVTCAASAAALAGLVETPGVSQFFGCTPIGPAAWGIVAASSAAATAGAALAPRLRPMPSPPARRRPPPETLFGGTPPG